MNTETKAETVEPRRTLRTLGIVEQGDAIRLTKGADGDVAEGHSIVWGAQLGTVQLRSRE
jgi:hypothetical protein